MFKKFLFAVVTALVMLSFAAFPVYARTIVARVSAVVEWVDSGIDVSVGETVSLVANGKAITGPLNLYPGSKSGPEGQLANPVCMDTVEYTCALEGAPFGALIGKVGSTVFLIGSAGSFAAPEDGRLYLAVNDFVGEYADNAAGFTVRFPWR